MGKSGDFEPSYLTFLAHDDCASSLNVSVFFGFGDASVQEWPDYFLILSSRFDQVS